MEGRSLADDAPVVHAEVHRDAKRGADLAVPKTKLLLQWMAVERAKVVGGPRQLADAAGCQTGRSPALNVVHSSCTPKGRHAVPLPLPLGGPEMARVSLALSTRRLATVLAACAVASLCAAAPSLAAITITPSRDASVSGAFTDPSQRRLHHAGASRSSTRARATPRQRSRRPQPGWLDLRVQGQRRRAFASCSSPHTTATLSNGPHTCQVRATDPPGK